MCVCVCVCVREREKMISEKLFFLFQTAKLLNVLKSLELQSLWAKKKLVFNDDGVCLVDVLQICYVCLVHQFPSFFFFYLKIEGDEHQMNPHKNY